MLVNLELYFNYILYGIFITWFLIYIQLPPPEIYKYKKKENFNNKCF
jgi:hypothetical protein